MICLGLYRLRDPVKVKDGVPNTKRYVITFPPFNFVLAPTDLVFVLVQFDKRIIKKAKSKEEGGAPSSPRSTSAEMHS